MKRAAWPLVLLMIAAGPAEAAPGAQIDGRVFERGSITPLGGAAVTASTGATVLTGPDGRFRLDLPPGSVQIAITAQAHEPLHVTETLHPGEGLRVEYRLTPRAGGRGRYEATVRGAARHEGERFTLQGDQLQQLPGSLGDPFRVVAMLPGVGTPLPLLPLYVIRGASPGENGFFLDGMRVPQLFHFLVGGGVVYPRLIERLDFYPGTYDVSFGHFSGGIIDAETRPAKPSLHGEGELRLYDASAYVEDKLPGQVRVEAAGHYGYPGPLIHLFDPTVSLQYWDYQLRVDWRGLTVEALGSYDSLDIASSALPSQARGVPNQFLMTFHRVQVRERARLGRVALEAALVGGLDQMESFGGTGVRKLFVGARANARVRLPHLQIYGGFDAELSRFRGESFGTDTSQSAPDQLGDLDGDRNGVEGGAFLEGIAELWPRRLTLTAGARVDVYHAGPVTLLGVDPRAIVRMRLQPWLSITGGFGLYQQPPSFPVALPGIDTFALQLGLQRAWQSSVGIEAKLPEALELKVTGYYDRFDNINDVVIDLAPSICTAPPPESLSGLPARLLRQLNGQSFGMEVLLRRHKGPFTGWLAYTLSRSERFYTCGLHASDFDQTHVLNLVGQVHLPWRLMVGARLAFATGRPVTYVDPTDLDLQVRNNRRLPATFELDLRVDREWLFQKWALDVFVEALNVTYGEAVFGVSYPVEDGVTRYDQPQVNGFRWILPSIGLRGRF